MRKKVLYAAGTAVLSLSLVACSDKTSEDNEANESAVEETTEETESTETTEEEIETDETAAEEASEELAYEDMDNLEKIKSMNLEFEGVEEKLLNEYGELDQDYFEVIVIYITEPAFSNAKTLGRALTVSNEMVEGTGDSEEFREVNEELMDEYLVSVDRFVDFFDEYEDVMTEEQINDLYPISEHYKTVINFTKLNKDNDYTLSLDIAKEFLNLNSDLLTTFKDQTAYILELYDNNDIERD